MGATAGLLAVEAAAAAAVLAAETPSGPAAMRATKKASYSRAIARAW
jgi:hypothetical protein